ncbi:formin-like protein 14 [Phragmites australis]|uniref:formin-like protein 14 n=1 Tax=Phragmites australis TaxID=29695 RepID=UPI002D78E919|nr:formin-like protein 14 [Phragmites australis]
MRASQTQAAQPLPLPLPPPPLSLPSPPAAPRRGRHRTSASSSSSSSSSVSTASFSSPSPSPAPSPRASTSIVVPFSWERHPGVPKNSFRGGLASPEDDAPLPLPPPLRPPPRRRRANVSVPSASSHRGANSDPFVAAFAECTRDDDGTAHGADTDVADRLWLAPKPATVSGRAERRWWLTGGGFVGFLDLYGCKSAMDVAGGAFLAGRRPVGAHPRLGRAARR